MISDETKVKILRVVDENEPALKPQAAFKNILSQIPHSRSPVQMGSAERAADLLDQFSDPFPVGF